ncbi:hypothetical protein COV28_00615 [candidate division WWE3 bacterium CG10_big_fil_rev_8_21_14_0_10_48_23]|uniref:Uncharacterized protein n=1 Tax=candidate division WWE3 bacterium CG_4_9_14_0_2_um_filter_48_10 TaxID=1975078 RepID=A0A2M8EIQ3_UNCKA|nr:MAG: hypothetical protein COY35_00560 [candidate division WWE3 bacterium CG_4_10_14_0_2_um_filter_47_8]PJC22550.1 MAG: hypothetical protein CO059_02255 [candidate division WWE3 bacterium CG_4_9_14_0_2_um_filter_48_10]PJE52223.1 MAG: hypothetical protein COV28_00615 [candidate division WWE3 bacterium CG10_big_fil_rev_8_21_14_0_10_48_23]
MTKVSRRQTNPAEERQLIKEFWEDLESLDRRERLRFLQALFTPTEIKMFSKRLGAFKLLYRRKSYNEISRKLNLTPTTINKLSNILHRADDFLLRVIAKLC